MIDWFSHYCYKFLKSHYFYGRFPYQCRPMYVERPLCFARDLFGTQTLISQTAESVKIYHRLVQTRAHLDISSVSPLNYRGQKVLNLASIFDPQVTFNVLWFRNKTTYRKSTTRVGASMSGPCFSQTLRQFLP